MTDKIIVIAGSFFFRSKRRAGFLVLTSVLLSASSCLDLRYFVVGMAHNAVRQGYLVSGEFLSEVKLSIFFFKPNYKRPKY